MNLLDTAPNSTYGIHNRIEAIPNSSRVHGRFWRVSKSEATMLSAMSITDRSRWIIHNSGGKEERIERALAAFEKHPYKDAQEPIIREE